MGCCSPWSPIAHLVGNGNPVLLQVRLSLYAQRLSPGLDQLEDELGWVGLREDLVAGDDILDKHHVGLLHRAKQGVVFVLRLVRPPEFEEPDRLCSRVVPLVACLLDARLVDCARRARHTQAKRANRRDASYQLSLCFPGRGGGCMVAWPHARTPFTAREWRLVYTPSPKMKIIQSLVEQKCSCTSHLLVLLHHLMGILPLDARVPLEARDVDSGLRAGVLVENCSGDALQGGEALEIHHPYLRYVHSAMRGRRRKTPQHDDAKGRGLGLVSPSPRINMQIRCAPN